MKQAATFLGKAHLAASRISIGTWAIGGGWGPQPEEQSLAALHKALDSECGVIDTAPLYGNGRAERLIAQAVQDHGSPVTVLTKVYPLEYQWAPAVGTPIERVFPSEHIVRQAEERLRRLQTDCLDCLLLQIWCPSWVHEGAGQETMLRLQQQGKIRAYGISVSDHRPDEANGVIEAGQVDIIEAPYSLLDQRAAQRLFPIAQQHGVSIIARSPLASGALAGEWYEGMRFHRKDWRRRVFRGELLHQTLRRVSMVQAVADPALPLAQQALRFCLSHPAVSFVIPGIRAASQARCNLSALNIPPLPHAFFEQVERLWQENFCFNVRTSVGEKGEGGVPDSLVQRITSLGVRAFRFSTSRREVTSMSIKAYKYRIEGNKATADKLQWVLNRARELYNAGLQERREAYEMCVKQHPGYYDEETRKQLTRELAVGYYEQKRELVDIKALRPEYREIASHVLQDVILRIKRTYDRFFERIKNGQMPGQPRFKGRNQYNSITYPDRAGWKLEVIKEPDEKKEKGRALLHLSKIGTVKVKLHRKMTGTIKTLTIKREGEHWYCVVSCEMETEKLPVSHEDVGIDLGVLHFAALSNSEFIDHPRHFRRAEKKLVRAQQAVSRKKKSSHRRARAVKRLAKQHRKVRNQRADFHHKASRKLVDRYQIIVLEELQTKNLTKSPAPKQDEATGQYLPNGASAKAGLTKSILDAGWGTFTEMVVAKAASAGRTVVFVDPSMTSQLCSGCGAVVRKDLSVRWHSCECGTELDRDTNSAKLILNLGYKALSGRAGPTLATA